MNLNRLSKIINNLPKIIEGFYNAHIGGDKKIKRIADSRLRICRTNTCGLYDKGGISPLAYLPGHETCAGCGCSLIEKCNSMSSDCTLKELYRIPLWVSNKF